MIREHPNGIVFNVFVQPRSSKNKIVGRHGDALKVKVTAPPVEGAANKMCLKFLAKCLATPYFRLQIITGQNSRTKQIDQQLISRAQKIALCHISREIRKLMCPKKALD
jgi:uncharacterized protein (TIGR00251 family)